MLIAHLSDSHISEPDAVNSDRAGELRRCIEHINGLDPQPDLVVHSGDVTHNGTVAEYAVSVDILSRLHAPFCVIPGNRDDRTALRTAFVDRLPEDCHAEFVQYAVMGEKTCVILLDSVSGQSNKGRLCEARLAHFSSLLDQAGDRQVAVFMHHPPFEVTESKYPVQFENWSEVDAFSSIVSQAGNVRHIYCGHSHRAAKGGLGEISASTIPSAASDLRMGPPVSVQEVLPLYRLAEA